MSDDQTRLMMEMKGDIAGIKAILSTMANTNEVAIKALESASSAHHRITDLAEDIKALEKTVKEDVQAIKDSQNWLPKLVTSTLITGVLSGGIGFMAAHLFI